MKKIIYKNGHKLTISVYLTDYSKLKPKKIDTTERELDIYALEELDIIRESSFQKGIKYITYDDIVKFVQDLDSIQYPRDFIVGYVRCFLKRMLYIYLCIQITEGRKLLFRQCSPLISVSGWMIKNGEPFSIYIDSWPSNTLKRGLHDDNFTNNIDYHDILGSLTQYNGLFTTKELIDELLSKWEQKYEY